MKQRAAFGPERYDKKEKGQNLSLDAQVTSAVGGRVSDPLATSWQIT